MRGSGVRVRFIVDVHELADRSVRVFLRCRERLVAEEFLNGAKVGAVGKEMRSKCVAHRVRVKIPIHVDEAADGTLREAAAGVVEEHRIRVRGGRAAAGARTGCVQKKLIAKRPVVLQRILRFRSIWNDAFFVALAAHAQDALLLFHVGEVQAGELAYAESRGVEQFEQSAIAAKQQAFFRDARLSTFVALGSRRARQRRKLQALSCNRANAWIGGAHSHELIQKAIHFFRREYGRNPLRQFRRGDEPRRILLQMAFADAVFEKRTQRRKLSRDGTLLETMVVQVTDELTDHGMGDRTECGRLGRRRRKIRKKLVEVSSVVRNGMRRGISYRPQIFQILGNRCFHSTLDLPWQTRRYSIGTPNTLNSESTGVLSINAGGSGLGCHGHGNFLGGRLRRCFRDQLFPVATFLETGVNGADFGALLDDERRPALWTRLGDGHVRRRKIAIRIARAAVKNARASAATLAGTAAADELAFIALRAFDAHGDGPRVLALRIAGAADELAEAAVFFHETVAAKRALFVQGLVGLVRDARALNQTAGGLAIRVTRASEERAEAAALNGHLLAAIVAIFGFGFAAGFFRKFRRKVLNEIAVGIPRAAEEEAMAADSLQQ